MQKIWRTAEVFKNRFTDCGGTNSIDKSQCIKAVLLGSEDGLTDTYSNNSERMKGKSISAARLNNLSQIYKLYTLENGTKQPQIAFIYNKYLINS